MLLLDLLDTGHTPLFHRPMVMPDECTLSTFHSPLARRPHAVCPRRPGATESRGRPEEVRVPRLVVRDVHVALGLDVLAVLRRVRDREDGEGLYGLPPLRGPSTRGAPGAGDWGVSDSPIPHPHPLPDSPIMVTGSASGEHAVIPGQRRSLGPRPRPTRSPPLPCDRSGRTQPDSS